MKGMKSPYHQGMKGKKVSGAKKLGKKGGMVTPANYGKSIKS